MPPAGPRNQEVTLGVEQPSRQLSIEAPGVLFTARHEFTNTRSGPLTAGSKAARSGVWAMTLRATCGAGPVAREWRS
jgi:hypothetical protein